MKASDIPTKFTIPFADSAGGDKRPIPTDSLIGINDGFASLQTGFPPLNFLPLSSGGVPPYGQDVNGILFESTSWDRWFSAGGPVKYDSAFQADIGGYPNGAVVASATTAGVSWRSTTDDNTTDPDAAGAGWVVVSMGNGFFNFATMAALRANTLAWQTVYVEGYYSNSDGGQGLFTYVSTDTGTPDNGGTIVVDASGRRYYRSTKDDPYDVRWFGAKCDGSTNDTAAVQLAITAALTAGGSGAIVFPAANCTLAGTLSITGGLTVSGRGMTRSIVIGTGGASQTIFSIATDFSVHFRDLSIQSTAVSSAAIGIQLAGTPSATPQNNFSTFERILFYNVFTGIDVVSAAYWLIDACQFTNNPINSNLIVVRNTTTPDAGDQVIRACQFYGGAGATAINWQSAGGTRVEHCVFLQIIGVNFNPGGLVQTGGMILSNNRFDGSPTTAISIVTNNPAALLSDIVINGNQFDGTPSNGFIFINAVSGTIARVGITGNTFIQSASSTPINIPAAQTITIVGNNIATGGTFSIALGAGVSGGCVMANLIGGNPVSNAGTAVTVGPNG